MHFIAGSLCLYATWLLLNVGLMAALTAGVVSLGAAVHGYCYGYRAWQIRHRRLRPLADAIRDLDTYLVL